MVLNGYTTVKKTFHNLKKKLRKNVTEGGPCILVDTAVWYLRPRQGAIPNQAIKKVKKNNAVGQILTSTTAHWIVLNSAALQGVRLRCLFLVSP